MILSYQRGNIPLPTFCSYWKTDFLCAAHSAAYWGAFSQIWLLWNRRTTEKCYLYGEYDIWKKLSQGGHPLSGTVEVSGMKNAAVGVLLSTILIDGVTVLENLPVISDVALSLTFCAQWEPLLNNWMLPPIKSTHAMYGQVPRRRSWYVKCVPHITWSVQNWGGFTPPGWAFRADVILAFDPSISTSNALKLWGARM